MFFVFFGASLSSLAQAPTQPVDYVSPNIDGIGQLLTSTRPIVQRPHGMATLAPATTPGITDHYLADKIFGFPAGPATLMASTGDRATTPAAYASDFDHNLETSTPYYYDGGETSSWFVLSAMGFYPACPGSPVYEIGSPIFEKTSIRLGNGIVFTIVANGVSARNKYIQSALLNGKPLNRPWFSHADIANGGTLVLEMSDQSNREWGSAPNDAPPSMTE